MGKTIKLIISMLLMYGCNREIVIKCDNYNREKEKHLKLSNVFVEKMEMFIKNKKEETFSESYETLFEILAINDHILERHGQDISEKEYVKYSEYKSYFLDILIQEQYYRDIIKK